MAFMNVTLSSNEASSERLPVLSYNAKAGRLFLLDRIQRGDGSWETQKTDVTMKQPAFAVDFRSLETGWALFPAGAAPMFAMAPYGQPTPSKPAETVENTDGKKVGFRQAFRVKVAGREIGGIRELAGNASTSIMGLNALHDEYEAAPEAAQGKIPVVKAVDFRPVKSGQSENFMPVYQIQSWVDRPAALGTATVPAPQAAQGRPTASAKSPANHAPPPSAAVDWDVEGGMPDFETGMPRAGGRVEALPNDSVPF